MLISEKVADIIERYTHSNLQTRAPSSGYLEAFRDSSRRKARIVADAVQADHINQGSVIYVSIGGAEGYEIEYLADNTEISRFVLFDINQHACTVAWERLLARFPEKAFTVICGDTVTNTAELHGYINELIRSPDDIVLFSIFGVLHELGRTPDIAHQYLRDLLSRYTRLYFYTREPCSPISDQRIVRLGYKGLSSETLLKLAAIVAKQSGVLSDIHEEPPFQISCNVVLAVETITKLFYIDDFDYEIKETITSLTGFSLVSHLMHLKPNAVVSYAFLNSDSFTAKFHESVSLSDSNGTAIPPPLGFIVVKLHQL